MLLGGRRGKLAASAAGVGYRPGRASPLDWGRGLARSSRRRRGFAGSRRDARREPGDAARDAERASAAFAAVVGDRPLARARAWPTGFQPRACRRVPAFAAGARRAGPAIRVHTGELRRRERDRRAGATPRPDLRGVADAAGEPRLCARPRLPDPDDSPAIQPNYLAAEEDRRTAIAGLRWARRLLATDALAPYRGGETVPGGDCRDDEALLAYARARGSTVYHAVGSCRMGPDPLAVVGPDLVLRGMTGLRIVDASVMLTMVSANTNAATMMIAEKASDFILADHRSARTESTRSPAPALAQG